MRDVKTIKKYTEEGWKGGAVDLFRFTSLREAKRRSNPLHDLRVFEWIASLCSQ
jgi:hypothetical protein